MISFSVRLASVFDWHFSDYNYSMYIWPFFSCFHRGKCRLLYFYIHLSLIDPIFTFSLQPGSGGKPFPVVQSHLSPFRNLGNFVHLTLPVSFGRDTKSRWSLLYGVYARGTKRSHTGGKYVTCSGLSNSREGQL